MSEGRSTAQYGARLAQDGIVVVEDYLDPDRCDELRAAVEAELDADIAPARPDDDYDDHASRDEPVCKQRTGERDDGMLDIFNMDLAVEGLAEIKADPFIAEIVNEATGEPYTADNINVYVNRSVTETRDFHADTYAGKFKSFVYLTDVPDESDGPFAYIPGSHEQGAMKRKASALVNRVADNPTTDAVFYDESATTVCTAPRGTLIIANQAGYHRGLPQAEGRERMLATTSYTPE